MNKLTNTSSTSNEESLTEIDIDVDSETSFVKRGGVDEISRKIISKGIASHDEDFSNYSFHLWTSKTPPIKYLAELLKDILTEGKFQCTEEGIKLIALDNSKLVLVHLKLFGDKFESYKCDKPINLSLNLDNFFKIIKNIENSETLRLFVHKNDHNHVGIERYNKDENMYNTIYQSTIELENSDINIPPATFDNVIIMSSTRFQKICREISQFSEDIEITSVGNQLIFRGHDTNVKQEIKIKPSNDGMQFESNANSDRIVQGVFKLKYLLQFCKCANLDKKIKIHFQNDYPLVIKCDVTGLGEIKLLLAPKIEDK